MYIIDLCMVKNGNQILVNIEIIDVQDPINGISQGFSHILSLLSVFRF